MANSISNYVKFRRGNSEAFGKLIEKDPDTLYFIYEEDSLDGDLYLGSKLIAGSGDINGATTLRGLTDTLIAANLNIDSFLIYDIVQNRWVDKPVEDILSTFVGTVGEYSGSAGLVPAPEVGKGNYFLRGDGEWAEVVTASAVKIYQTVLGTNETIVEAIDRTLSINNAIPNNGDIIIIKECIIENKYQNTSYIFNGEAWVAMDGAYNAENIYFDDDLTFTYSFGRYTPDSTGNVKVPAKGMNLKSLLENAYSIEDNTNLIKAYPTASISGNIKYYEIGTTGSQEIIVSLNSDGEYKYGYSNEPLEGVTGEKSQSIISNKTTGVVVNMDSENPYTLVSNGMNIIPVQNKGEKFIFNPEPQVERMEISVQGGVKHTQGRIPVSNFGKLYPEQRIKEGEKNTGELPRARWYIPMYQGFTYSNSSIANPSDFSQLDIQTISAPIDSTVGAISKIIDENAYAKTKITSATAEKAWRQYFLIVPKEYEWKMQNAKDANNIDCTVKQGKDIIITFGDTDIEYNVYYIHNAADYGTLKINWTI